LPSNSIGSNLMQLVPWTKSI